MNGRSQIMQGCKNWILPKEIKANQLFPSMEPNGGSMAMHMAKHGLC
jgi:hypothetical protein